MGQSLPIISIESFATLTPESANYENDASDFYAALEPIAGFDRPPLHVGTSAADIWYSNWPDTASTDPAQVLGHDK